MFQSQPLQAGLLKTRLLILTERPNPSFNKDRGSAARSAASLLTPRRRATNNSLTGAAPMAVTPSICPDNNPIREPDRTYGILRFRRQVPNETAACGFA